MNALWLLLSVVFAVVAGMALVNIIVGSAQGDTDTVVYNAMALAVLLWATSIARGHQERRRP